jgi:hypothetical protein
MKIIFSLQFFISLGFNIFAKNLSCSEKNGDLYLTALIEKNDNHYGLHNVIVTNQQDAKSMYKFSKHSKDGQNVFYRFKNPISFWFTYVPNLNPSIWDKVFGEGISLPHPVFGNAALDIFENRGHWNNNEFVNHGVYLTTIKDALRNSASSSFTMRIVMNWEQSDDDRYENDLLIDKYLTCVWQEFY